MEQQQHVFRLLFFRVGLSLSTSFSLWAAVFFLACVSKTRFCSFLFLAGAFGRGVVCRAFDNDPSLFFCVVLSLSSSFSVGGVPCSFFCGSRKTRFCVLFFARAFSDLTGFKWVSCFCVLAVRFLVCAGLRRLGSAVAGLFFVVSSGCVLVVCFLVGVGLRRPSSVVCVFPVLLSCLFFCAVLSVPALSCVGCRGSQKTRFCGWLVLCRGFLLWCRSACVLQSKT